MRHTYLCVPVVSPKVVTLLAKLQGNNFAHTFRVASTGVRELRCGNSLASTDEWWIANSGESVLKSGHSGQLGRVKLGC